MRFALDEINNSSSLLPNITLGYSVFDTCYMYNTIQPALTFMSQNSVIYTENSYINYIPNVISVIGPDNSDAVETTADFFSLMLLPQINIFATCRRKSLPSFFQTVPSRIVQQQAILDIISYFNWTWIAVLGSSDEYGIQGVHHFLNFITDKNICVAYKSFLPNKALDTDTEWKDTIHHIVTNITLTNVNVILVFSTDTFLLNFFKDAVDLNLPSKIWLATETWSLSQDIYDLPNIEQLGVVFGIALHYVKIPNFDEYLMNVYYQNRSNSGKSGLETNCNQNCDDCLNSSLIDFLGYSETRVSFSTYAAVYAVAHALHNVLGCDETLNCNKTDIYPWQITEALREVNFSFLNNNINFDQNGDSPAKYDIVYWKWSGGTPIENVGSYNGLGNLDINPGKIDWKTTNNVVPSSVCSAECLPGQEKQQNGQYKCCFICVNCAAGTYLNENGTCENCSTEQWSTEGSTSCFNKAKRFLTWKDSMTIPLFVVTILGMLLNIGVMVTFTVHLSSPVVKAAGGRMCFLMLISLTVAYISILAYLGEPNIIKCIVRLPIYSIALTICFAYISIRSFQIVCIFKMSSKLPATYDYWVKQNGQYICLAIISGVQVLISCVWIIINPPTATTKELSSEEVLMECSQFGSVYNILQYSYNALLSLLCFTFAYMGKELPKNYSEAKCITFSMLIYFAVCISFFTAQLIDIGEYVTPVYAGLALLSLMGVTAGYFFPKCYIIFCRPQFNTTKHFQTTIQSYTKRGSGSTR
ncbi:taste receptor type 1 member 2-like [Pseudophryne corroboree]|uniref:taste receptor type 1 member 2-like n=1 Tax=Pseudophryne corroboree TaxID=495146 RepID=UPI003081CACC